jgi:dTDP-4-dehydrorhamnose reductase
MNRSPIWVTGAGGLIGNYLLQTAPQCAAGAPVTGFTRAQLDLADFTTVRKAFGQQRPQAVVHCAALSRTTECQSNPSLAHKLNVEVTAVLAELAAAIPFVFFSSDLVFDGRSGNCAEDAPVNPLSVYAESKVVAEQIVLANPRHLVVRTSLNGGISPTGDRGFNEQMLNAWIAGQSLKLFTDEFRSPIPAEATARATWELLRRNKSGLYHVAGSERLSRWQIGQLLAARCPQLSPKMEPVSLQDYRGAPRPPDTSLDCSKAQKILSFPLPRLSEWLVTHNDWFKE